MNDHPLPQLRKQLLSLHRMLMLAERAMYEKEGNVIHSSSHLLQLLMSDERFAWLRELSQFIVVIDEALEEKPPITRERADALVHEANLLLTGEDKAGTFAKRYIVLTQSVTSIAEANTEIRRHFGPSVAV